MFSKAHPLDLTLLLRTMTACIRAKIRYGFGQKIADLRAYPPVVKLCDCSGGIRYLVYQATAGFCKMPDGSVNQHEWCDLEGLHKLEKYADIAYADPFRVFICFIPPIFGRAGHVWLVNAGMTLECHGP